MPHCGTEDNVLVPIRWIAITIVAVRSGRGSDGAKTSLAWSLGQWPDDVILFKGNSRSNPRLNGISSGSIKHKAAQLRM